MGLQLKAEQLKSFALLQEVFDLSKFSNNVPVICHVLLFTPSFVSSIEFTPKAIARRLRIEFISRYSRRLFWTCNCGSEKSGL
jgi:hypothetical protein